MSTLVCEPNSPTGSGNCSDPLVVLPVDPLKFPGSGVTASQGVAGGKDGMDDITTLFVTSDMSIVLVVVIFFVFVTALYTLLCTNYISLPQTNLLLNLHTITM